MAAPIAGPNDWWWIVPLVSLVSAFVGAGTAFLGLRWRYKADYRGHLVTYLLTEIQAAADLSTEYWLLDLSSKDPSIGTKAKVLEARIEGFSERIDASVEIVRPHLGRIDTLGMERPWTSFLNDLTGGDFAGPDRQADFVRARSVQRTAAVLIRELRVAADRRVLTK